MTRWLAGVMVVVSSAAVLLSPPAAPAQPAGKAPTSDDRLVEEVRTAIERGIAYLKKEQRNGNWEDLVFGEIAGLKGGVTSLATLALLTSGVKPGDPVVDRALQFLKDLDADKTYVVALQTMVLAETRDPRYLPKIQKNVEWLQKTAVYRDGKLTGWSYPAKQLADNSNTQYALLGLYAAKTAGVRIDDKLWKEIQDFYTRTQLPDGNRGGYWTYYYPGDPAKSFTMTVAGACGLYIANMGLDHSEQQLNETTGVAERCGIYSENTPLAKGMRWIALNFNFMEGKSYFYNFYGIERLGRLSGQRFIGRIDWYREGCQKLVRMQQPDGSFSLGAEKRGTIDAGQSIITTSFALLFLSKGRTPVLISKFAWGRFEKAEAGAGLGQGVLTELDANNRPTSLQNWNRKHNDCRNLVEFASREIFENAPLSWQVYDPRLIDLSTDDKRHAEVGLLVQSPIVYLTGHGAMPFVSRVGENLTNEELILQKYVEEGGFLLAEACCGDREFAQSFEELVDRIFPGSTLRPMPAEHAIWTMFPGISKQDFPDLMYIDRGCRTIAVFSPSPLAGYWEESRFIPTPNNARDPKNRGEKAFCLARNIIAYATGMELPKPKLTRAIITPAKDSGIARSQFRALQLKYSSQKDSIPAPDSLRNLMAYLEVQAKLNVAKTSEVLVPTDQNLHRYKFMYLHGRAAIDFTPDEMDNLKANLQTGGTLLVDAACADFTKWKQFDQSFRAAMEKMWADEKLKLEIIPTRTPDGRDEPLYRIAAEAGIDLKNVRCRRENADGTGPEKELRTYPVYLEGIKIGERWAVIYSKYDIGCAIEGHKSADCLGHDKESALRIASAVVLYSLKR